LIEKEGEERKAQKKKGNRQPKKPVVTVNTLKTPTIRKGAWKEEKQGNTSMQRSRKN